jgi:hypothetical protein
VEMVRRRLLLLKSENLCNKMGHYVTEDGVWAEEHFMAF